MVPPCLPCLISVPEVVLAEPPPPPPLLPPQAAANRASETIALAAKDHRTDLVIRAPPLCGTSCTAPPSSGAPQRPVRGFNASCRPSPTRLNASTVSRSASPGNVMYHQAVSKISMASAIIAPQLAVGGWTPTPRNESAASNRMFVGISKVV